MSRPRPLDSARASARAPANHTVLTPRTPLSRAGLAEEGYTEIELDRDGDDSDTTPQNAPLLRPSAFSNRSSSSMNGGGGGGYRSRGDDYALGKQGLFSKLKFEWSKVPLYLGIVLAGILFVAIVVSISAPTGLNRFAGLTPLFQNRTKTTQAFTAAAASATSTTVGADADAQLADANATIPSKFISYDAYSTFPLTSNQYRDECAKLTGNFMVPSGYWNPIMSHHMKGATEDGESKPMDVYHPDEDEDAQATTTEGGPRICSSTITYMLDGKVGLFADLALIAQAAALARERNRTFLIDDSYWNRGKWTDHFEDIRTLQAGPEPGCKPPPANELVACPRTSRHWVITSRTAKYHFGHGFADNYEDPFSHMLEREKPIYQHAYESLKTIIRPNEFNARLIREARSELKALINTTALSAAHDGTYISVHIRRGDRHPTAWKYHDTYIPIADYVKGVLETTDRLSSGKTRVVYLASDSPAAEREFVQTATGATSAKDGDLKALEIYSLFTSQHADLRILASEREYVQGEFDEGAGLQGGKTEATRGVIVDFALLSGAWDWDDEGAVEERVKNLATVCAFSSNICNMAAVAMGWEKAFGDTKGTGRIDGVKNAWVDVDGLGSLTPAWRAFEMF